MIDCGKKEHFSRIFDGLQKIFSNAKKLIMNCNCTEKILMMMKLTFIMKTSDDDDVNSLWHGLREDVENVPQEKIVVNYDIFIESYCELNSFIQLF